MAGVTARWLLWRPTRAALSPLRGTAPQTNRPRDLTTGCRCGVERARRQGSDGRLACSGEARRLGRPSALPRPECRARFGGGSGSYGPVVGPAGGVRCTRRSASGSSSWSSALRRRSTPPASTRRFSWQRSGSETWRRTAVDEQERGERRRSSSSGAGRPGVSSRVRAFSPGSGGGGSSRRAPSRPGALPGPSRPAVGYGAVGSRPARGRRTHPNLQTLARLAQVLGAHFLVDIGPGGQAQLVDRASISRAACRQEALVHPVAAHASAGRRRHSI